MRQHPALSRFAESSPAPFIDGIRAARDKIVARSDQERQDFLRKRGFSKAETGRIVETVLPRKAAARECLRLRAGDHRGGPVKAAAGCAVW